MKLTGKRQEEGKGFLMIVEIPQNAKHMDRDELLEKLADNARLRNKIFGEHGSKPHTTEITAHRDLGKIRSMLERYPHQTTADLIAELPSNVRQNYPQNYPSTGDFCLLEFELDEKHDNLFNRGQQLKIININSN
ncbi:MAG: hypothetical protein CMF50_07330 [Legionellales bacterium]|nr:hypothetical protein [Legionellales bacterium]|tara:strand:+ start:66427 stop:66831 length:405 start_codon:yes stop_codon:yes gene_type:complete